MTVKLRLTFPADTEVLGITLNGQRTKIKQVEIPVNFTSAKGQSAAAFLEVVVSKTDEEDGDAETGRIHADGTLVLSGRDGQLKLQSRRKPHVAPAFLASLFGEAGEQPEADEEEDDDELLDTGEESEDDEGETG